MYKIEKQLSVSQLQTAFCISRLFTFSQLWLPDAWAQKTSNILLIELAYSIFDNKLRTIEAKTVKK